MNKSLKKLTAILLTVCMALALCACSSGGSSTSQGSSEGQTTKAAQETTPANDDQAQESETAAKATESAVETADTSDTAVENAESAGTAVSQTASTSPAAEQAEAINYLALVNKLNPLPEGWEDALETVHMTNSIGDDVEVEKKAYDAYLLLKEDLEKEGVYVDLDSARRSVAEQQRIMNDFTEKYGADYALKTVAQPGYSEHHTGLALDLYLIIDGKDVVENEDMIQYPEIWETIHSKLADYGFILRYLQDKEHITGYGYEPWHIRYVDDVNIAKEIMASGVTLEGWLGAVNETDVEIDYGTSEIFTPEELAEAAIQIKCTFAGWKGCELHSLRYAGDEADKEENLQWLNSLNEEAGYTHVAEFLTDFHSPVEAEGAWEPDQEYKDYQWWLGRTDDGGWEVVTSGY
jgi:D-alanyl-D-alanine carboxypeptidase